MDATAIKDWNAKVRKANLISERLEENPDSVSMNECFFAMSICFGEPGKPIPISTLKSRYKKLKKIKQTKEL